MRQRVRQKVREVESRVRQKVGEVESRVNEKEKKGEKDFYE